MMSMRLARLGGLVMSGGIIAAVSGTVASGQPKPLPVHVKTVWVIVMENQKWAAIILLLAY
jgi:hypothetical protein